jgi:hypothetical protein
VVSTLVPSYLASLALVPGRSATTLTRRSPTLAGRSTHPPGRPALLLASAIALTLALAAPVSAAPPSHSIAWQPGLVVHFGDSFAVGDAITWSTTTNGTPVAELRVYLDGAEVFDDSTVICNDTSVLVAGFAQSFGPLDFGPTQVWQSGVGTAQVTLVSYDHGHYRVLARTGYLTVRPAFALATT